MRYQVVEDRYLQEFDIQLYAGDEFVDGDLEPDVVANLAIYGAVVPLGATAESYTWDTGDGVVMSEELVTDDYTVGVDWAEGEEVVFSETVNYNSLTRAELDTIAEGRGITIETGWNKSDVIAALIEDDETYGQG